MKAYKHILVPTDGSKLSFAAAKEAAMLAIRPNAATPCGPAIPSGSSPRPTARTSGGR
jgi:nucleotide-binding universal stress UspA family protein